MFKQFVVPIVLVLALVTMIACTGAAPNSAAAPAAEEAAASSSNQVDVSQLSVPGVLDIGLDTPLCVIFPTLDGDGQQYIARGTENGDGLAAALGLSHGEIVFDTIVQEIDLSNAVTSFSSVDYQGAAVIMIVDNFMNPSGDVVVPDKVLAQSEHILIVGVDIGSWEIDRVKQAIENEIQNLVLDPENPNVTKFVINMSFALVPCNDDLNFTLQEYENNALSFDDFSLHLNALIGATYGNVYVDVRSLIKTGNFFEFTKCLLSEDPYAEEFYERACDNTKISADTNIVLVGAAGNSQNPFAFAPAIWDQVVSVSACDKEFDPSCYSNTGEVMMDGSTRFTDVIGTSFASPRLALAEAKRLLSIPNPKLGIRCSGGMGWSSPPLGYILDSFDWDVANDGDSEHKADLPLPEAEARYCNP